jgi:hypothetical protein
MLRGCKVGEKMAVHGRERDGNFQNNFNFNNKAAFHNVTVIIRNVHIWGTKRPREVAGWRSHSGPKEAAVSTPKDA